MVDCICGDCFHYTVYTYLIYEFIFSIILVPSDLLCVVTIVVLSDDCTIVLGDLLCAINVVVTDVITMS